MSPKSGVASANQTRQRPIRELVCKRGVVLNLECLPRNKESSQKPPKFANCTGVWLPFLEIRRNRPKSPFFCLFRPFPEGPKSSWKIQKTEEKGLFPQISSDFLKPPSLKPPFAAPQSIVFRGKTPRIHKNPRFREPTRESAFVWFGLPERLLTYRLKTFPWGGDTLGRRVPSSLPHPLGHTCTLHILYY